LLKNKRSKAKLHRTSVGEKGNVNYTWDELYSFFEFAKKAERLSSGTIRNRRGHFELFMTYLNDNYPDVTPHTITVNQIREFIVYLQEEHIRHQNNRFVADKLKTKGLAVSSINSVIRSLKAIFNFLHQEDYIEENPFKHIKQMREDTETVQAVEIDHIRKILKAMDMRSFSNFRDACIIQLIFDCGLRIQEALSLEKNDLDLKTGVIEIKGSKAKMKKSRFVPISPKIVKMLRELQKETEEFGTSYVFTSVYGEPYDKNRFRQRLKRYAANIGLESANITPHKLRHAFARYYLLNHGNIASLSKILGHANLNMTKRYLQLTNDEIKQEHQTFSPTNQL
jgi:integrase/recombinase XerD